MFTSFKKVAFTLAEVLVVLAIIGMVYDMTIPQLKTNVTDRSLATMRTVTKEKILEAMNQMRAQDELTGYTSAENFLNKFKKYIKVIDSCNDANLTKCFGYDSIKIEGGAVDVSSLKDGKKIALRGERGFFQSKNVGIQLANGVTAIMNYNDNCEWLIHWKLVVQIERKPQNVWQ